MPILRTALEIRYHGLFLLLASGIDILISPNKVKLYNPTLQSLSFPLIFPCKNKCHPSLCEVDLFVPAGYIIGHTLIHLPFIGYEIDRHLPKVYINSRFLG